MSEPTQAQIDGAKAYEGLFVQALFAEWAPRVADAAQIRPGQRVLDVACGTGILAREVATRVGTGGRIVGIDASPGMVAVARSLAPAIDIQEAVAEALPFPDRSFDAVVSQFGLMFFTDRRKALEEMHRVLVPGGRLVVAVWDTVDNIPAYAAATKLLQEMAGDAAADALRAPFPLGDRGKLAALFASAGMSSAEITTHRGTANFPSIRTMVEADLRGWLPLLGVILTEDRIAAILQAAESVLRPYSTPDGRAVFDVSAHLVTARKP